jgi:hypothetical protein
MEDMTIEKEKTFWEKVKETVSSDNISKGWKITRNITGILFVVGSLVTGPACPFVLPAAVSVWVGWGTLVCGVIAGKAQLDTSKKK